MNKKKKLKSRWMALLMMVGALLFIATPMEVKAFEISNPFEAFEDTKEEISDNVKKMDKDTLDEIFSFIKDKVNEGSLNSEDGIREAIEQSEEKFDVLISPEDAQRIVDTMNKLEDMGFSVEQIFEKAETLYNQYGADFVDHLEEAITSTVKDTVFTVVGRFFKNMFQEIVNAVGSWF